MRAIYLIILFLFAVPQISVAQRYAGISIDNDLFFGKDYYYSSGIFLQYGYNKDTNAKAREEHALFQEESNKHRGINSVHWTLGQQIFNPIKRFDSNSTNMDYPFSGYLFIERIEQRQKNKNELLEWGVQLGLSGPPSLSKPLQNNYHEWVLGLPPLSWVDQQPAGVHFGLESQWVRTTPTRMKFNATNGYKIKLGTHQSEISLRTGLQWGSLNPLIFYGSPLANNQRGWSTHLGIQLKYNLQDYNLSGSLFNNNAPFTLPNNSLRNTLEAGIAYSMENWQFMAMAKARSKDTPGQKYDRHQVMYVSILKIW